METVHIKTGESTEVNCRKVSRQSRCQGINFAKKIFFVNFHYKAKAIVNTAEKIKKMNRSCGSLCKICCNQNFVKNVFL